MPDHDPLFEKLPPELRARYDQERAQMRDNLAAVVGVYRGHAAEHGGQLTICSASAVAIAVASSCREALIETIAAATERVVELENELAAARHQIPSVAFKGPDDTDASKFRRAAANLDNGYDIGGGNLKAAVAALLRQAATTLDGCTADELRRRAATGWHPRAAQRPGDERNGHP